MKQFAGSERRELRTVVRTVRRRWRTRNVLRGLLFSTLAIFAALLMVRLLVDHWTGGPASATAIAVVLYCGAGAVAFFTLLRPMVRQVSDLQVALYLEEHQPELRAEILTAVGTMDEEPDPRGEELLRGLIRSAVLKARDIEGGRRVDREPLKRLSWSTAGLAVVLSLLLLADPMGLRQSVPDLVRPWTAVETPSPLAIHLFPGDTLLARGAELQISARLDGFAADEVEIAFLTGEAAEWDRWPMIVQDEEVGDHEFMLFRVDEPMEYFAEAQGIRSGTYRIDVVDVPYVSRLELELHHPAYTGLAPETIESGGDIFVLPGTRVVVRAHPTITVPSGRIVLEGLGDVAMTLDEAGVLHGQFQADQPGFYRVDLDDSDGAAHRGSPDHLIDIVADLPPIVALERPARDVRVTSVEEVYIEAQASDDYAVDALELIYSVNGGDEQTISLLEGSESRLTDVSAGHTFFLEEFELEPGDLVAYHVRALDSGPDSEEREARTDLFFIEVRPFSQDFRQAEQGGGGGGGGGGGDPMAGQFSERQREIVTATFNVGRDWRLISPELVGEDIATISLSQASLRDEVNAFLAELQGRLARAPEEMRQVAEELPLASAEMESALVELERGETSDALSPEQRALQHLLRAEAVFREIQLAQQQNQGGGGGGASGAEIREDLADFFDLEMDRLRNQYEELQQGERQQMDQEMNQALERLRELARRQEQEQERLQRVAERLPPGAAGAGGESQRRLAEEAEELARELERLSREYSSPELAETARELQEAANAMRRSATARNQEGVGQASAAQEALEDARRLLERDQANRLNSDAGDAVDQARRALDRQREIEEAVQDLPEELTGRSEALPPILEQKEQLIQELENLETDLNRLADEATDDPRAERGFREAASAIRDGQLPDRVDFSRGLVASSRQEQAEEFEAQISELMEELNDQVQTAAGALDPDAQDRAAELAERTRELVQAAESMEERARQAMEGQEQAGEQQGGQEQGGQQQDGQPQGGQQAGGQQGGPQSGGQSQGGQQQGGGPNQAGGNSNGGGGSWFDSGVARQLSREAAERRLQAEELREQLEQAGVSAESLDNLLGVIERFRDLEALGIYGNSRALAELQQGLIESLRALDFEVRRHFATADREGPMVAGSGDVPEGYQDLVEEYFRSLAR